MKLNPLNKALLILIALSLSPACRTGDGGEGGGKYVCQNGTPKDGKSQTQNDNKCKACNSGYALDSNEQCVSEYHYICPNGTPRDGITQTQNDNKCKACNEGYSLENMSCTIPATPAGMGTEASPYVLLNYAHLKTMGNALNKHYKLGATIDARDSWSEGAMGCSAYAGDGQLNVTGVCSNTAYTTEMDCTAPRATWTSGSPGSCSNTAHTTEMDCTAPRGSWTDLTCRGWVPVGNNSDETDATRFTGSLDGNGHTIMNLYTYVKATSGATYTGLFGVTDGSAEIKNLGLKGIYVNVSYTTAESYTGGLAGINNGAIINSYATGPVTASGNSHFVGGLVGDNGGSIINSYATSSVTVSGVAPFGGGLVGLLNGGAIINSYTTGEVTGMCTRPTSLEINGGGLVGRNSFTPGTMIQSSYATGNVSLSCSGSISTSFGGGLVGYNKKAIENSYATGRVACIAGETCNDPLFGGLVGENSSTTGTISGTNYFVFNDASTEDDDDGVGSGGCAMGATCAERTLAQLQALNEGTALGWNTTVWDVSTTALAKLKYVAGFCSDPAHTTQAACTVPRGTWESGSCSDSSLTTQAACTTPRGTWESGSCSDPAHTTQAACTAPRATWESGSCLDTSLTTQAACTAPRATWRAVAACETIASNDKTVNQGAQLPDCGDLIAGQ